MPSQSSSGDSTFNLLTSLFHSCLLDIVGARFHCAICDSVDICSNCESAGLPGNLDSADGGHNSSHILIKVYFTRYTVLNLDLSNALCRFHIR